MTRARAVEVAVVGGGLSGLVAARCLHARGVRVAVLEARDRVGGRTLSVGGPGAGPGERYDLGASWLWPGQDELLDLLDELGIGLTSQHERGDGLYDQAPHHGARRFDAPAMGSLRVRGGTQALAERVAGALPEGTVRCGHRVLALEAGDSGVQLGGIGETDAFELRAARVVAALPPRLTARLAFSPTLPGDVTARMAATPTWMAQTFKVVVGYAEPFWRDLGLSGFAFSHAGPLREIHDATVDAAAGGALLGMAMAGAADLRALGRAERHDALVAQLVRVFGARASDVTFIAEHDWAQDPATAADRRDGEGDPAVTYGAPALAQSLVDGRLVMAGTETAERGAGQLHGAVLAGRRAAHLVLEAS